MTMTQRGIYYFTTNAMKAKEKVKKLRHKIILQK